MELSVPEHPVAPVEIDLTGTFEQIHGMPKVNLRWRTPMEEPTSRIESLPQQLFMRIMMYCGYREQTLLKECSHRLYRMVDLEAIPWEVKTEAILCEERDNPKNFPKKEPRAQNKNEPNEDGGNAEAASSDTETTSRTSAVDSKKNNDKTASDGRKPAKGRSKQTNSKSKSKQAADRPKAHPDTYGKWGCYCCYKVLPAHYFEGQLLEDKESRVAKNQDATRANADEADKKVDMRVEYVQILGVVPGGKLPDWLTTDMRTVQTNNMDDYVRQRMERGVNQDDLRAYYRDINREKHLVAPLRSVNPTFTILPNSSPKLNQEHLGHLINNDKKSRNAIDSTGGNNINNPTKATAFTENIGSGFDAGSRRPLYKLPANKAARGGLEAGGYTYELFAPRGKLQDERYYEEPTMPDTKQVGHICLPQKSSEDEKLGIPLGPQVGDVVSLRRVCIPCGTKFAVYRRDCNRKIISKTQEAWWVCDCKQVRLAGMSDGCKACGSKVIY
ncbi:hypothetical protein M406DRAFT_330950 [Cryphonectria parasitica EP155]|uniref:F-box domain-containing protein n=1 Tax=Cryphonectria parasitica (strain ATCC 38755 / EP155) TaxID=660469 RepID=A0A9P4Y097_CRYP1|nr:uncharacterized protein M406DRAFT_330950 [Cryphonectria parasitica EP155]KAF3764619.1 hypothetical protein M406DRAFT_330950 [Cryphonectria parasitica EP155]